MSDQRYSADLVITAQDFAECNWKSTLASVEGEGYRLIPLDTETWIRFSQFTRFTRGGWG